MPIPGYESEDTLLTSRASPPHPELIQYFVNLGINLQTAIQLAAKVGTLSLPSQPIANGVQLQPGKVNLGFKSPKPGMDTDIERAARPYVDAVSGVGENGPQFARESRQRDMQNKQRERLRADEPAQEAERARGLSDRMSFAEADRANKFINRKEAKFASAAAKTIDADTPEARLHRATMEQKTSGLEQMMNDRAAALARQMVGSSAPSPGNRDIAMTRDEDVASK